ncbi:MAG: Acg family FMN-binding oxidoreductase [Methanosarcinaceae archaeon]
MAIITWQNAVIAFAGILVIGIFALVIVDGTFLHKQYLEPWAEDYHEQFEDPRVQVLAHGVLSPNSHNLQSWRVVLEGEDSFLLYVDTDRLSPKADPPGRQATVSQGTFLEYVRIAAEELGYEAEIELFPEGEYGPEGSPENLDSKPVARVSLKEASWDAPEEVRESRETGGYISPLYPVMFLPDTYRVSYRETKLQQEDIEKLEALSTENVNIVVFQEAEDVEKLGDIALRAAEVEAGNSGVQEEGSELFRPNEWEKNKFRYGFTMEGQGLSPLKVHVLQGLLSLFPSMNSPEASRDSFLSQTKTAVENTPAYALIITEGNSRTVQVESGILYSRFLLTASDMGYAMQPLSQATEEYPEMAGMYKEIHEEYAEEGETVQMLVRIGVPEKEVPPTMRLDVMDIIEE